jgi:hypothetical protein
LETGTSLLNGNSMQELYVFIIRLLKVFNLLVLCLC